MSMSVGKAIELARRAHGRDARRRQYARAIEHTLVRKSAVLIAAGTYGALKRNSIPDDIAGFPWKLIALAGATLVEFLARDGTVKAFAGGVSDATAAVYMDRAIVNKTLVAGEFDAPAAVVGAGGEF